ncbi:hypothetical protein F4823DRAFT_318349 [Ustulina deusta]|nr:hypothetical protein F4823DRAFT_318349 [Ustulina deusta]
MVVDIVPGLAALCIFFLALSVRFFARYRSFAPNVETISPRPVTRCELILLNANYEMLYKYEKTPDLQAKLADKAIPTYLYWPPGSISTYISARGGDP